MLTEREIRMLLKPGKTLLSVMSLLSSPFLSPLAEQTLLSSLLPLELNATAGGDLHHVGLRHMTAWWGSTILVVERSRSRETNGTERSCWWRLRRGCTERERERDERDGTAGLGG